MTYRAGRRVASSGLGLAGGTAVQSAALGQQLRPGRPVNDPVHPAASQQGGIGGIDDGVHLQFGDVPCDSAQFHGKPSCFLNFGMLLVYHARSQSTRKRRVLCKSQRHHQGAGIDSRRRTPHATQSRSRSERHKSDQSWRCPERLCHHFTAQGPAGCPGASTAETSIFRPQRRDSEARQHRQAFQKGTPMESRGLRQIIHLPPPGAEDGRRAGPGKVRRTGR